VKAVGDRPDDFWTSYPVIALGGLHVQLRYIRWEAPDVLHSAKAQRWEPAEPLCVLLTPRSGPLHHRELPQSCAFPGWEDPWHLRRGPIGSHAERSREWLGRHDNVVVAGPSRSHLCEALGHAKIAAGLRAVLVSVEHLSAPVRRHRVDYSVP
jgi:hypothetical protein